MSRLVGLSARLPRRGQRRGAVAGRSLAAALVFAPAVAFGVVGASAQEETDGGVGAAAVRTYSNPAPINIIDNSSAGPDYPSTLLVTGLTGTVEDVTLRLRSLSHDNPDDIDVILEAPDGQSALVMSDAGGAADVNTTTLTLQDGQQPLPDDGPLTTGTFGPANYGEGGNPGNDEFGDPAPTTTGTTFAAFDGAAPNGTWRLYVRDDTAIEGPGTFGNGWSLTITTSNTGPRAVDDRYTATAGERLIVRGRGVLANDTDPDGDRLTVRRVSAPRKGTVRLDEDGSFIYRARPDESGRDTFIYEAKDAGGQTDRAVVTIEIKRARDNDRDDRDDRDDRG